MTAGFMIFRRGLLTKTTVGIIIAVIVIALFLGFGNKAYGFFFQSQDEKSAQALVDEIAERAEPVKEGEEAVFTIKGVGGWYLTSWNKGGQSDKCFLESCLCISPEPTAGSCDDSGFHRIVSKGYNVDVFTEPFDFIERDGDEIELGIVSRSCIPLAPFLMEINVKKTEESIVLSFSNSESEGGKRLFDRQDFNLCASRQEESSGRFGADIPGS